MNDKPNKLPNPTEIEKTSTEADTSNDSSSVPTTSTTTTTKSDTKLNKILLLSSLTETTSSTLLEDNIIVSNKNRTKHELATGYGFNEDQIGIFEETFQIFDKDYDGFITLAEIRSVMNSFGVFPCDENIRKSIQNIDIDNSGTVDFEEFINMMSKFRKFKTSKELEDELKEIFNIFDKNQDGFIDMAELKDVLIRLGEDITDEEVIEMIREADTDGDNKVSFADQYCMRVKSNDYQLELSSLFHYSSDINRLQMKEF